MIRDRGTIKWTAMMLPEHVKLLKDWMEEDKYQAKPELDEQQLEEMNELFCEAMTTGSEVTITYYDKNQHCLLTGKVHHYHEVKQELQIVDASGEEHYLQLKTIIGVRFSRS